MPAFLNLYSQRGPSEDGEIVGNIDGLKALRNQLNEVIAEWEAEDDWIFNGEDYFTTDGEEYGLTINCIHEERVSITYPIYTDAEWERTDYFEED